MSIKHLKQAKSRDDSVDILTLYPQHHKKTEVKSCSVRQKVIVSYFRNEYSHNDIYIAFKHKYHAKYFCMPIL